LRGARVVDPAIAEKPDAPVRSCYEAGRDDFWLHCCLAAHGITNLVVDPPSIEAGGPVA
jgi:hypothetical protein